MARIAEQRQMCFSTSNVSYFPKLLNIILRRRLLLRNSVKYFTWRQEEKQEQLGEVFFLFSALYFLKLSMLRSATSLKWIL